MPRYQQDDSESSPLLRGNTQQPQQDASQPSAKIVRTRWLQITNPQTVNVAQSFIILCITLSAFLAAVPQAQLLEDAVCREYYDGIGSPRGTQDDELRCKINPIEARLASLSGISSTLEMIAELIVALPLGILADRIGKRPIMIWAALSSLLSLSWALLVIKFSDTLPVSMVLFSFVPRLLGGGETVLLAMLYAITADIAPAALRANYFLQLGVGSFLGQSLGSLVASSLMDRGYLWLPILLGYIVLPVGLASVMLYPDIQVPAESDRTAEEVETDGEGALKHRLSGLIRSLYGVISIIKSPSAAFIMFSFTLISPVTQSIGTLLVMFVSMRFGWTFAQAGYLLSIRGFGDIFVFLVFIPAATKLLMSERFRFRLSSAQKDLVLAKFSLLLVAMGTALITLPAIPAVVSGVITVTFGFGWLALCRSLMIIFTDEAHISQLYSLIGIVESVGALISQPSLAAIYGAGLRLGHPWEILPFVVISLLCMLAALLIYFVRLPNTTGGLRS